MIRHLTLCFALIASAPSFAQSSPPAKSSQAATIAFAQKAALRALNFRQGDQQSLTAARADFTPDAWKDYMKHMEGFLDPKGAPAFSSSFVPSGKTRVVGEENGLIHVRIPGTLTQTQGKSATTYRRFAVDVMVGGKPMKITHLEQTTCSAASTACQ